MTLSSVHRRQGVAFRVFFGTFQRACMIGPFQDAGHTTVWSNSDW